MKAQRRGQRKLVVSKKQIRAALGGEQKYYDINMSPSAASGATIVAHAGLANSPYQQLMVPGICIPSQGTAANQRVGRRITLSSIDIKVTISPYAQTGNPVAYSGQIRMIVYCDKNPSGTTGSQDVTNAATYTAPSGSAADPPWVEPTDTSVKPNDLYQGRDILGNRNLSNTGRFWVVKEKILNYGPTERDATGDANPRPTTFHLHVKRTVPILFKAGVAGTNVPDDIVENNIGILFLTSGEANYTQNGPNINFNIRSRYYDE